MDDSDSSAECYGFISKYGFQSKRRFISCVLNICSIVKKPYKPGSWRTMVAGLDESSVLLLSCGASLFIGWIAHKASNGEMPMKAALPILSFGGVILYFTCLAAMDLLFRKN
ncbi:UNVERIFIED_CONTAM: hypothetical protein NCL1_44206 [Trichonephila clavipes]